MFKITRSNLFILIVLSLNLIYITGCATPPSGSETSKTLSSKDLNKDDVLAHVAGKTEEWSKGAGYYAADGQLEVVWEGKQLDGTWEVKDDGKMCITVYAWGDEDCHSYKVDTGVVKLFYQGVGELRKIESGNTLDSYL